jgi:triosephosphate isomerase (TIM)
VRTLIVNMKNYDEVLGEGSLRLAEAAAAVGKRLKVEVIVAPPTPMVGLVSLGTSARVFGQSAAARETGRSTGAVVLEALKAAGAGGVILNHSEAPISEAELRETVAKARRLKMNTCVCAAGYLRAAKLARLSPDYLAVEPPELIGTGIAVSKAKPEVVSRTVEAARSAGYQGRVLCGAGITSGEDVTRCVALGAAGVLVSSSVVKAHDWPKKLRELAEPLS